MSLMKQNKSEVTETEIRPDKVAFAVAGVLIALAMLLLGWVFAVPLGTFAHNALNSLLAIDSERASWYITRSAGIIAYLLLWLSMVWGLAVSNKFLDPVLQRMFTFDLHELLSLLALGFTALHMAILLVDTYMPFTLVQILLPFVSDYRPGWIGIGVIGFYLMGLVSLTFYARRRIGQRAFRLIHFLSYLSYLGVTLHSIFSGSDSTLTASILMYGGTFLVVIFMTAYRVALSLLNRRETATRLATRRTTSA